VITIASLFFVNIKIIPSLSAAKREHKELEVSTCTYELDA
jgi:hypothetical protein